MSSDPQGPRQKPDEEEEAERLRGVASEKRGQERGWTGLSGQEQRAAATVEMCPRVWLETPHKREGEGTGHRADPS